MNKILFSPRFSSLTLAWLVLRSVSGIINNGIRDDVDNVIAGT